MMPRAAGGAVQAPLHFGELHFTGKQARFQGTRGAKTDEDASPSLPEFTVLFLHCLGKPETSHCKRP